MFVKNIKIYTTAWCGYCTAAKHFFKKKGWAYDEINIDKAGLSRQDLLSLGKGMTVPQIIIDGQAIGGYDDLVKIYG